MSIPPDNLFQSSYRLQRVPQDPTLLAWNAADDLLIHRLQSHQGSLLLLNDPFGALSVALHDRPLQWWHASAMSREALVRNCQMNKVNTPSVLNDLTLAKPSDAIALHIPKSINYFAWLLEQSVKLLKPGQTIYALGMAKHISAGHISLMNSLFAQVNPGRAVKKARVIELSMPTGSTKSKTSQYHINAPMLTLTQLPGCFAENRADPGALTFIHYFDRLPTADTVLDLGCGNGILGMAYARRYPAAQVWLVDDNLRALDSARQNWINNELPHTAVTCHSNGLNGVNKEISFDLVLCNPPFHQDNTVTETIARKLFADAKAHLSEIGELWVVANRHLPYSKTLNTLFRSVDVVSKHPKFVVLRCRTSA